MPSRAEAGTWPAQGITVLTQWAQGHRTEVMQAREAYDRYGPR